MAQASWVSKFFLKVNLAPTPDGTLPASDSLYISTISTHASLLLVPKPRHFCCHIPLQPDSGLNYRYCNLFLQHSLSSLSVLLSIANISFILSGRIPSLPGPSHGVFSSASRSSPWCPESLYSHLTRREARALGCPTGTFLLYFCIIASQISLHVFRISSSTNL